MRSSPHPGSSIFALGSFQKSPVAGPSALPTPGNHSQNAAQVFLKDLSLSTSGTYEKSFRVGGQRYSHIRDPRRGVPGESAVQVTVLAPSTFDSEVWAICTSHEIGNDAGWLFMPWNF